MNFKVSYPALRRTALILVILVTGGILLRGGFEPPPPNKAPLAVPATLVQVKREDVANLLIGVGTVQAMASVTVKARIDGQLEHIDYVEGQDVKAGQVLAQLDTRPLRAQLEQVQAQKARDEAQLVNARLDLDRYSLLIKEDATSRQTLDTQKAQVAQLQAAVQNDEAQIHYAQVQLGYATITAPFAGRTGARLVDPGNIVHASDANGLVVINQIDPISVLFTLPGDSVQAINRAQNDSRQLAVLVYGRDDDKLLARGTLGVVNNQIDVASGTIQLKGRFANSQHQLWPGQYVNVRLQLGEHVQALTVPASVVQRSQSGTYAYVIANDGTAEMRPIDVLQIQDGKAVIAKGLQAGETVVLDGQYKIKPGLPVVAASTAPGLEAAR
jgi:multidrug efflux system membrane fusion protein